MNVLLLTSHSIAEHDDLDMFTRMGVDTFSIGAYTNPAQPGDDKRPALPNAPYHADLEALCHEQRVRHAGEDTEYVVDWAKGDLAQGVIDWADTIIVHHFPERWISRNWARIRDKRVIWRTCGQSNPWLEAEMSQFPGLQIVRYSPKEREAFGAIGAFAGEHAMIRFGKDPVEWSGWTGDWEAVGNITQHMQQRGDACGFGFWDESTAGLPVAPVGPGSEAMRGGVGPLPYDSMREYLKQIRVYLYTGTRPASYTLGLIEAMLTGTPVVSIGAGAFYPAALFEADDLTGSATMRGPGHPVAVDRNDPASVREFLSQLLTDPDMAAAIGSWQRQRAIDLFGLDRIMGEWAAFLGVRVPVTA